MILMIGLKLGVFFCVMIGHPHGFHKGNKATRWDSLQQMGLFQLLNMWHNSKQNWQGGGEGKDGKERE